MLAILAGAFVALGASFMLMVRADSTLSPSVSLILGGLAFCLGLFLVLVAGAELFTGNCLMLIGAL
ncbi:MAG: formate/nitrite transporter family protein [Collinsella sp.]